MVVWASNVGKMAAVTTIRSNCRGVPPAGLLLARSLARPYPFCVTLPPCLSFSENTWDRVGCTKTFLSAGKATR